MGAPFIPGGIFSGLSNEYRGPMHFIYNQTRKFICLLITLTLLSANAWSQKQSHFAAGTIRPLKTGEILPLSILDAHADLTGKKLIILDFWATWCSVCIKGFPRIDSMQQLFKNELQVILVNQKGSGNTKKDIDLFFSKRLKPDQTPYRFTSIIMDSILEKFFPHAGVPHYVWLNAEGRVLATTATNEINQTNILKAIKGEPLNIKQKVDQLDFKRELPLLHYDNGGTFPDILFRSLLTKSLDGLTSPGRKWTDSTHKHLSFVNYTIYSLVQQATGVRDHLLLMTEETSSWTKSNRFSYEINAPISATDAEMRLMMKQDLERYLQLKIKDTLVLQNCQVLVKTPGFDSGRLSTKGGKPVLQWKGGRNLTNKMINQPLSQLILRINALTGPTQGISYLDETGITQHIDMELVANFKDLPALNKELQSFGLQWVEAKRTLKGLAIEKIK